MHTTPRTVQCGARRLALPHWCTAAAAKETVQRCRRWREEKKREKKLDFPADTPRVRELSSNLSLCPPPSRICPALRMITTSFYVGP